MRIAEVIARFSAPNLTECLQNQALLVDKRGSTQMANHNDRYLEENNIRQKYRRGRDGRFRLGGRDPHVAGSDVAILSRNRLGSIPAATAAESLCKVRVHEAATCRRPI